MHILRSQKSSLCPVEKLRASAWVTCVPGNICGLPVFLEINVHGKLILTSLEMIDVGKNLTSRKYKFGCRHIYI